MSFSAPDVSDYSFTQPDEQGRSTTVTGSASCDGVHRVVIQPTRPAPNGKPIQGVLTVEMTDVNQQTVTESRVFQKAPAAFYLGIAVPETFVVHSGVPIPVQCVAVTPDGKPLDQAADVQLE